MKQLLKKLKDKLIEKGYTISCVESCTGGLLSNYLTDISGSSQYFKGSVIAYSNEIKIKILNVKKDTLRKYGAVSKQVARQMAENIKKKFNTNIAVSLTGIAGPKSDSLTKPVGLIYIGFNIKNKLIIKKCFFKGNRTQIKKQACLFAIHYLFNNLN